MINQWGLYAGLDSNEASVAQPAEPEPSRLLTMVVACIVAIAAVLAATVVLYRIG
ncbi:hypothetical protein [Microlunatus soli]|uniref:Uncharacterized protein n=1 Tax=Microlunatus soli TaxID=630515 RepID=A0A1H1NCS9_9ACTN|nr:hypothetical protein [Microlunatus soli]SDR96179.1 hypothetical protein SAMN04489812_0455 [Microlunatus soli]